jgi:hypothetical protein
VASLALPDGVLTGVAVGARPLSQALSSRLASSARGMIHRFVGNTKSSLLIDIISTAYESAAY